MATPSSLRAAIPRALRLHVWLALSLPITLLVSLQPAQARPQSSARLVVAVVDENGVPVAGARLRLTRADTQTVQQGETDPTGRYEFAGLEPGTCHVRAEKEGFYPVTVEAVRAGETENLEIVLNHLLEFAEVVNVVESPPAVDPAKTVADERLGSSEIIRLPYPTTRDIRNALPLLPGVLPDSSGQVHVHGSATQQVHDRLDGFNITSPFSGQLHLRVSVDALRSIEIQDSRYSVEFGKGSGGVLSQTTGMGDDRLRFSATDFIPSFQARKGIHLNNWTPRFGLSGPLRKGKAWFYLATDGEYGIDIIEELPAGADRSSLWRVGQLARMQVNLTSANLLTAGVVVNRFGQEHAGISPFDPEETSLDLDNSAYHVTVKEQSYLAGGTLVEVGLAFTRFADEQRPQGTLPYEIRPDGRRGNFFRALDGMSQRVQGLASALLPLGEWFGRHQFKLGVDFDRVSTDQTFDRRTIFILRDDGTLSREIAFPGITRFERDNLQAAGFLQDRWSMSDRLTTEIGVRFDGDSILGRSWVSPRLAVSYGLTRSGDTKLAAGVGVFHDATNLEAITRPQAGARTETFYAADGVTPLGPPIVTSFAADDTTLNPSRVLNWSVALEHHLRATTILRLEYLEKRGRDGLAYFRPTVDPTSSPLVLASARRDRYRALQVSVRHTFRGSYVLFGSYMRSRAATTAALDFTIDNPLFGLQAGGPLPWDAPNRLLSWGWLPLKWKFDLAYTLDWRNGYPFGVVNEQQQLVGAPNSQRFPTYFTLNVHVERRFRIFGGLWALRGGFDNITDRGNPAFVNNNVDSPQFLTFGGVQSRAFIGRIRFLGKK